MRNPSSFALRMSPTMALRLRHGHKLIISTPKPYFTHFLSTTTTTNNTPDSPDPPPNSNSNTSPFSSYFNDVKSSLKNQPTSPPPPSQRPPFNVSDRNPRPKIASFDEIRKNLAEYRRRSDLPPPPDMSTASPPASKQVNSFQDIYNRNAMNIGPVDDVQGRNQSRMSFDAIRESLRTLKNSGRDNVIPGRRDVQPMSLTALRNSLSSRNEGSGNVIGSGFNLTSSLFGKDVKENEDAEKSEEKKSELLRSYSHVELGERLKGLRPDKKVGFSLSELNERLVKLRELEEKQSMSRMAMGKHRSLDDLRESLRKLKNVNEETSQEKMDQRLSILNRMGPSAVQGTPKEQLVEKYFHPDNMSAAEKLKLELAVVRDEFKMSESDCGSARVQVAQLTTKIKYLSDTLHKKDKHSRKGLNEMVQLRKKLLKYLRRTDWDSYAMVLSKLGLRDNSEVKKSHQNS